MKKHIRLNFTDFWPDFNIHENYFTRLLQTRYNIEISAQPDFIIYSIYGNEHTKYNCMKIFYTGENMRPNFKKCDFAFTNDYIDDKRHYRLPLYTLPYDPASLIKRNISTDEIMARKTKFCNFVYSNSRAQKRNEFFHKLSQYKQVDSGGRHLNNIGGPIPIGSKLEFIKDYKFTIAFENSEYPGYTTEKLVQAMLPYSIPIYWGNPVIYKDFNTKSFINYYDFANEDELIKRIIEIDQNDELYKQYLLEPYYHNNVINEYVNPENVLKQFEYIFSNCKMV